ncbi:galactose mutarotase [Flagellimonas sp. HMM57]|uniref:aldose epimerase family protein n=1 Tax=unclassified Flagellimonas TaxID=2644544 RepID=UPI0013D58A72|nr:MULTISPECIES: aldose epimerase family protein [unclassified Flagellimonas]UII76181.1 galactose mutarotase [Flagellimonas sp. HMM57]
MELVKLTNSQGMELQVCDYGATLVSLKVPNKDNGLTNVVVGLDNHEHYASQEYQNHQLYLGTTIGRYAGRISNGSFNLEGDEFALHHTDGVHLHGGKCGFDKKYWTVKKIGTHRNPYVVLSYESKHLEENYPGNLKVEVTYQLLESNAVKISYTATTDKTTVVNLTNHSYFNLSGNDTILGQYLKVNSDHYIDVDEKTIPTGKINPSKDTRFDYNDLSEMENSGFAGLDDTFILNKSLKAASLWSKKSGLYMKVFTNQPAIVIYTPEQLPELSYYEHAEFERFPAICFEAQNYPDAPNNETFPSSKLLPGSTYLNETVFDFTLK